MQPSFSVLLSLLVQAPLLLTGIVCLGLSIALWRRHPQVSALAIAGFIVLIIAELIAPVFSYWFSIRLSGLAGDLNQVMAILYLSRAVFMFIGWGLILAAIFGWRSRPAPPG